MTESASNRVDAGWWSSLEAWSATLFLVASAVFLLNAVHEGIARYTALGGVGFLNAVAYLSALVVTLVGLLGFYPRMADRSPTLARASAVIAVVAAISTIALLLWASTTQLLNRPLPPGSFLIATVSLIVLGVLLFCIASLRTAVPSRTVGVLLLTFVAAWLGSLGAIVASGSSDLVAVSLNGVSFAILLAVGSLLRTERAATTRAEPASAEVRHD